METDRALEKHSSFRDFLTSVIENEKSIRGLGSSHFAATVGISSSLLSLIIKGKRTMTLQHIHRIATVLQMDYEERSYFEAMVLFEQSSSDDERHYFSKRLEELRTHRHANTVRKRASELIEHPEIQSIIVYLLDVVSSIERNAWLRGESELDKIHITALAKAFENTESKVQLLLDDLRREGILSVDSQDATHFRFDGLSSKRHQARHLCGVISQFANRMDNIFAQPDSLARTFAFSTTHEGLATLREEIRGLFHRAMGEGVAALDAGQPVCLVEAAVIITPAMAVHEVSRLRLKIPHT